LYFEKVKKDVIHVLLFKKVEKFIRSRGVFPEDLMFAIQTFFEKKNEASKIKYVRFAISDEVEPDKRI